MIKGSFFILLFYFLGELLGKLIGGFIPGSVLGMILLFLALYLRLVNPDSVRKVATGLTKSMAVFFVPAGVGLMVYAELVSRSLAAILTAIGVSTVLTILTVSLIQDRLEKRKKKGVENE